MQLVVLVLSPISSYQSYDVLTYSKWKREKNLVSILMLNDLVITVFPIYSRRNYFRAGSQISGEVNEQMGLCGMAHLEARDVYRGSKPAAHATASSSATLRMLVYGQLPENYGDLI
jgi:hypothetical protein